MSLATIISEQKRFKYRNLLILLSLLYFVKVLIHGPGDFAVYYGASNDILRGNMIYLVEYPIGDATCAYSYPPFFAMILIPIAALPLTFANGVWLLLNLFFLIRIFQLIEDFLEVKTIFTEKTYRFWAFLTLLCSVRFILYNYDLSQSTFILLWGCLESLDLALKKRPILSGAILAMVISIKLLPLVMLPYFVFRRHFKAAIFTTVFFILFNLTPSVFYGFEEYKSVLNVWKTVINPVNPDFILDENREMESLHSLSALLSGLLTDSVTRFNIKRNIAVLSYEKVVFWLTLAQLFFIGLTLFFLKTRPFVAFSDKKRIFWEVSYILLVVPLIFPHQQKYAFVMLLPAFSWLWFYILSLKQNDSSSKILIALMVVVWLLTTFTTDGFIGKKMFEYCQYFKLITWGTMLLIIPLSMTRPKSDLPEQSTLVA